MNELEKNIMEFLKGIANDTAKINKTLKVKKRTSDETPYLEIIYTRKECSHENPEKVKFPAFCMFTFSGEKKLGAINTYSKNGKQMYSLFDFSQQWSICNRMTECDNLKVLMDAWKIQIVKAKIIIKRG